MKYLSLLIVLCLLPFGGIVTAQDINTFDDGVISYSYPSDWFENEEGGVSNMVVPPDTAALDPVPEGFIQVGFGAAYKRSENLQIAAVPQVDSPEYIIGYSMGVTAMGAEFLAQFGGESEGLAEFSEIGEFAGYPFATMNIPGIAAFSFVVIQTGDNYLIASVKSSQDADWQSAIVPIIESVEFNPDGSESESEAPSSPFASVDGLVSVDLESVSGNLVYLEVTVESGMNTLETAQSLFDVAVEITGEDRPDFSVIITDGSSATDYAFWSYEDDWIITELF